METPAISPRIREPLRRTLAGEPAEWPELMEEESLALAMHGVASLVYATARVLQLRGQSMHAAAIEPIRLEDLRAVLDRLGADVLLIKGTPLAYEIYPAPELRPRGDTDLLIARDSLDAVRAAFREMGFSEHLSSGDEHAVRQVTFSRRDARGVEHAYDVHWNITNTPLFAETLRYDELLARAVAVPAIGANARTLSRVDALLLACIHRVAHHHDSDRLIWLVDIALLRDRMTRDEHAQFWRMASDRGVAGVCIRSVELADDWCARAPQHRPEEFLSREEIERDEPSRVYLDREITYGRVMLADFRALPWRARLRRLWQLALPPAAFMRQSFRPRSRFALPWLYVYRGARGIRRLFRRARA